MKKLALKNNSYQKLLIHFREWLDILGYAEGSIHSLPNYIQEFLHYLEANNISSIKLVNAQTIQNYYTHLSTRANEMFSGGLTASTLNHHIYALKTFNQFLSKHGAKQMTLSIQPERVFQKVPEILTTKEVKELFTIAKHQKEPQNYRDTVILICLYSLGLRLHEAGQLQLKDIDIDHNRIIVRKGKNGKQRQIPFNQSTKEKLEDYLFEYRGIYPKAQDTEQFILGIKGALTDDGIRQALERLAKKSNIEKKIHPHLLRHSIASHLLQNGMELTQIQQFLGHSSLESTQIYTHIIQ